MFKKNNGFTLIEVAIVMVIIGLMSGGAVSILRVLQERKNGNEAVDYLKECKEALMNFAITNGRFPWADSNAVPDGTANNGAAAGWLPYLDIGVKPIDPYGRVLRYAINPNLGTNLAATCSSMLAGLAGPPTVVDADGAAAAFSVAVILISGGPMDANGDGSPFDLINAGVFQGNNVTGNPNYLRNPPTPTFDDIVLYIGRNEIFRQICGEPILSIVNNSGAIRYIRDTVNAVDIGLIPPAANSTWSQKILSGTRIQLRTAPAGGGAVAPSTPTTAVSVAIAGNGLNITIP